MCFEKIIKNSINMYFNRSGIVGGFLAYMTLTKEQPANVLNLKVENNKERVMRKEMNLKLQHLILDMLD